jgi:hypothetical protein
MREGRKNRREMSWAITGKKFKDINYITNTYCDVKPESLDSGARVEVYC